MAVSSWAHRGICYGAGVWITVFPFLNTNKFCGSHCNMFLKMSVAPLSSLLWDKIAIVQQRKSQRGGLESRKMAPPWPQLSPAAWPLNFPQPNKKTKILSDKTEWNSAKVMVKNLAMWGQYKQALLKNWTVGKFIHQSWSLLSDPVCYFSKILFFH